MRRCGVVAWESGKVLRLMKAAFYTGARSVEYLVP